MLSSSLPNTIVSPQVKELHDLPMLVFRSVQTWPDDSERFSNIPERLAKVGPSAG